MPCLQSSAAISITKQEPALCTSAPVAGVSTFRRDSAIATKLMHIDRVMLTLIVLTVALDSRFKYGIFDMSSLIRATSAASAAMSLPMLPIAIPTLAVFSAGRRLHRPQSCRLFFRRPAAGRCFPPFPLAAVPRGLRKYQPAWQNSLRLWRYHPSAAPADRGTIPLSSLFVFRKANSPNQKCSIAFYKFLPKVKGRGVEPRPSVWNDAWIGPAGDKEA